ncbi:MAG: hypothetical protein ACRDKI_11545 [Solirubrobacterales bacterium]
MEAFSRAQRAAVALFFTLTVTALCATAAHATVAFDGTFGSGGTAVSAALAEGASTALAPDGKIVVAGTKGYIPLTFGVARFKANGTPDPDFGSGGVIADAMPGPDLPGYYQARVSAVAVQSDKKIVLVGVYQTGSVATQLAIVRLNENGTPDADFGSGGRVLFPIQDGASATGVAIAANGDIVAGGYSYDNSPYYAPNVVAVKVDSNGDPVNSFGGDGVASTDFTNNQMFWTGDVLIDGDGVLVVGNLGYQMSLTRFKANGDIDTGYGAGGTAKASFPENSDGNGAVRLPDGRVVVAGSSGSSMAIARFTAGGGLDPSYGFGGMLTIGFAGSSRAYSVAARPGGKLIVAGTQGDINGSGASTFALVGTNADGTRDESFGAAGKVTSQLPLTSRASARKALFDADGKLLVAGSAGYGGIGMARYTVDDENGAGAGGIELDADFPSSTKAAKLKKLTGDVGAEAKQVDVALRLNLGANGDGVKTSAKRPPRCQWMKSTKAKFTGVKRTRACGKQVWLRATIDRRGHWKLPLKHRLPRGKYTVFMRALNAAGATANQVEKSLRVK